MNRTKTCLAAAKRIDNFDIKFLQDKTQLIGMITLAKILRKLTKFITEVR